MKLILISPPQGENGKQINFIPMAPSVLEYLAGLTLKVCPDTELQAVDANVEQFDPASIEADLAGISVMTPHAPWAYKIAGILRKRGITVILGGPHIMALPEEASVHADSLILGEAEEIWSTILADFARGRLKARYIGPKSPLKDLPVPATHLSSHKYRFGSFFTARGCPFSCRFCYTPKMFGNELRLRPISEVVSEVAQSKRNFLYNIDNNIWANVPRSIDLYRELAQNVRRKYWFGMADLVTMDHPRSEELLKWARRSGLVSVRVGWESNNEETLQFLNAKQKQGRKRIDALKKIRAAGIDVNLFLIVGNRTDSAKDYEKMARLCEELDVAAYPQMFIPLPDTDIYKDYEPYLIPGMDWDRFNGARAVFNHPQMSPEQMESLLKDLWTELFRPNKVLKRLFKISWKGFPVSHISSLMSQLSERNAFLNSFWP